MIKPSSEKVNLAIFATHPIQYQVPWFRALAQQETINLKVYFGVAPSPQQQGEGFGVPFEWDIPLTEGYQSQVLGRSRGNRSMSGFFDIRYRDLASSLRRDNIQIGIVTGWNSWCLLQALRDCQRLGIRTIVRGESNTLRPRGLLKRLLHHHLLKPFDRFLVIGESNRNFYRLAGIDGHVMYSCPYFVDNAFFQQHSCLTIEEKQQLRDQYEIPKNATVLLFAGKLEPKKRIIDVLLALRLALKNKPRSNLYLLLVGNGEQRNHAEEIVQEYSLPVTFTGFVNQTKIPLCYAISHCLIVASDFGETWGLVVNEAMASGVPAIVSDRTGCGADLIVAGKTGEIFPYNNVSKLAELMLDVEARPAHWNVKGMNAQNKVSSHYSVKKAVEGTLQAVASLTE